MSGEKQAKGSSNIIDTIQIHIYLSMKPKLINKRLSTHITEQFKDTIIKLSRM